MVNDSLTVLMFHSYFLGTHTEEMWNELASVLEDFLFASRLYMTICPLCITLCTSHP